MKQRLRDNGLSLTVFGLFLLFLSAQTITGWKEYNADQRDHHQSTVGLGAYLGTGHFAEAVFENWESEFLQMGAYVVLTTFLYQRGSAESKDPDKDESDTPESARDDPAAPGPVRRGGWRLKLYEHSLSLTLFLFFGLSFIGHAIGGSREYSDDQKAHGQPPVTAVHYLGTSRFWFESFQNWQSEFLAMFSLIVLSIRLREKNSPESKKVASPHHSTGSD